MPKTKDDERAPRRFSDIRVMLDIDPDKVVSEAQSALKSVGAMPQGAAIQEYLTFILLEVGPTNTVEEMYKHAGRKLLAEDLIRFMDGKNE